MGWAHHVILPKVDTTANGDRFLTSADVDSANDLALPVQFSLDPKFQLPGEFHVVKHV